MHREERKLHRRNLETNRSGSNLPNRAIAPVRFFTDLSDTSMFQGQRPSRNSSLGIAACRKDCFREGTYQTPFRKTSSKQGISTGQKTEFPAKALCVARAPPALHKGLSELCPVLRKRAYAV